MRLYISYLISFFTLVALSCNLLYQSINPDEVQSMVSATLTAMPVSPTDTPASTKPAQTQIPTPLAPRNLHPAELQVAFIGPDRNLYAWKQSAGLTKLQGTGDIFDLKISGDGELIAFVRQDNTNQHSSLWLTNFDGSNPREVMTWNDLSTLKTNPENLGTAPTNLRWIPGTHTLTFISHEVFEGPGMALNDDLITVDGDSGAWNTLLKTGQGGVAAFSPNGQWMALSTAQNVTIMDVKGIPAPGRTLEFEPVATYSEYQYYPAPVWAADSRRLAVFIPTHDPLAEPRQPSTVWMMDVQGGNPALQAKVTPQFIGPVSISPDLEKLFYVKETGQPAENRRDLRTAQINGQGEDVVFTGGIPVAYDWSPDSEVFAYQTSREAPITVSKMNGSVGNLTGTDGTYWFAWVDSTRYLFSRVSGDMVELYLGDREKGNLSLAALPVSDYFKMLIDFVD